MFCLISENAEIVPCVAADTRRYMFAAELRSDTKSEYEWNPYNTTYMKKPPVPNENEALRQILVIRRVILGPTAKEGERNTISVVIDDPEAETESFPMVHLSKGKEVQSLVDLTFPERINVKVKFVLTEGTGPIHLVGYHFVERLVVDVNNESDATDDDEDVDETLSDEEKKPAAIYKRPYGLKPLSESKKSGTSKKVKATSEDLNKSVMFEEIDIGSDDSETESSSRSPSYSPV